MKTKHFFSLSYHKMQLPALYLSVSFLWLIPLLSFADSRHLFVASGVLEADAQLVKDFAHYLAEHSNYPMKILFAKNYAALSDVLNKNPNAVAWTCGAPYVEDQQKNGQQLVAVPLFKGKPSYHSLIITLHGRPEKALLDFKDQVFAYSDLRSNSGYIAPHYQLITQGVDSNGFFKIKINAHNHVGSIEAVLGGLADVAAVDEYVLVEYLKNNPMAAVDLQILEKLGPYPFTPIVTGNKVKQEDMEKLRQTLLNMSATDKGKELLKKLGLNGFVSKNVDFYQPVKDMLMQLRQQENQ
ncbi:MAG: PhnD/SsuA/transferrin family substrate-binding protein [gamma proteobacterium symbiont of Taylorina sp.]|nr:PhnD/SsuA/transferrin family substrate-binding protein [gamma proteobacterium symbiont of Taylorina sp.]